MCRFCSATVFIDTDAVERSRFRETFALWNDPKTHGFAADACVTVGGRTWALGQRLGRGRSADVHAATLARVPTERAVIKLAHADADPGRLAREQEVLVALQGSNAGGAAQFTLRLPQPIARGLVDGGKHDRRHALVLRWSSGFVHTLAQVRAVYPRGVTPRTAVWMLRRILETLSFAHRSGVAHGGLCATRLLVHAPEHGVMLVGWSDATDATTTACAGDIAAAARVVGTALEGAATPAALATALADLERPGTGQTDAWAVRERITQVAQDCFGPPVFEHFKMPGW